MKTIVIGDTHGRDLWKQISNQPFDVFVFIGDYFDTHENITVQQQMDNFRDILAFKKSIPDKVILLTGNHDYHYTRGVSENYSGYNELKAFDIMELLDEAKTSMQMAYLIDEKYLCTHAGVSKTWCFNHGVDGEIRIDEHINLLFKETLIPFRFQAGNTYDDTGDDICQTPIWIRPNSLFNDRIEGYNQIVGHTYQRKITPPNYIKDHLWFIDALGTSKEYVIIEDNKISVHKAV